MVALRRTGVLCGFLLALWSARAAAEPELPVSAPPGSSADPLADSPPPRTTPPIPEPGPPGQASGTLGSGSPFAVRLAVDLPLTLALGVAAAASELVKSELPGPYCGLTCSSASVNGLDRLVIGQHSSAARTASDVLAGLNIGLPFGLDFIDVAATHPKDGFGGFAKDALVLAEVFAVNAGVNAVFKYAVRRPRPYVYDPDSAAVPADQRLDPDAALSFYSEHSSTSFAMATAYSYLFMKRHPGSKLVVPVWLLSEGLATATASLRVVAGKHFITDVLTGAAIGSALGVLIPYLHQRALPAGLPAFASQLRISALPTFSASGGGLLLSIE